LTTAAWQIIEAGNPDDLGPLMNANHRYLQELTVSSPELDHLVAAAVGAGALGAKLSGGGRGGNMIALVSSETQQTVEQALRNAGAAQIFATTVKPDDPPNG
jgi:mevalonate kinase